MKIEGLPTRYYFGLKNVNLEFFLAIVGFSLIGLVLFSSSFLVKGALSSTKLPKPISITITNVTNNSFTISWKTSEEATGYIFYGSSPEELTYNAYDNEAPDNLKTRFKTVEHKVTLTNLNPETYYYYKIVSNNKIYDAVNGEFFKPVKTTSVSPFLDLTNKGLTN